MKELRPHQKRLLDALGANVVLTIPSGMGKSQCHPQPSARDAWTEFYRAVRVLRRLRQADCLQWRRFSHLYWRTRYQFEYVPAFQHGTIRPKGLILTSVEKRWIREDLVQQHKGWE